MVNGIIDGMDSISAVDGYCRGAVFCIRKLKVEREILLFSTKFDIKK